VTDKIYCCRSGSAADTQAVSDAVRSYLAGHSLELDRPVRVSTAAHLFQAICYQNKDRLMASIICAGWDEVDGGSVYSVPLGGAKVKQSFTIGGSGSSYIYGFCDSNYRPGMTKEECHKFVKNALSLAMYRDGSSGGVMRLVTIDKDGVSRDFVAGNKLPYMDNESGLPVSVSA